jgi:hypothetical protein
VDNSPESGIHALSDNVKLNSVFTCCGRQLELDNLLWGQFRVKSIIMRVLHDSSDWDSSIWRQLRESYESRTLFCGGSSESNSAHGMVWTPAPSGLCALANNSESDAKM